MEKFFIIKNRRIGLHIISALLLWVLVGFILYPTLKTVQLSLIEEGVFSFGHYSDFFSKAVTINALKNTVMLGFFTVLLCGFIGTLLAFAVHFFECPFGQVIDKVLLLPLVLPGLIIVFSFVQLYGESGLVTKSLEVLFNLKEPLYSFKGLKGILFVHAYTQYIYFYMNVTVGIKHIDKSAIEAAKILGASKWRIFVDIIIPFLKPALISSSIITFMSGIGSFSAPSIIGGHFKVLTTQILLAKSNNYMAIAATQVIILVVIAMSYLLLSRLYERKVSFVNSVRSVSVEAIKIDSKWLRWLLLLLMAITITFIVLPVVTIIVLSFVKPGTWMIEIFPKEFSLDNYVKIFTKARSFAPFLNSIKLAVITSIICMIVATASSYIIVKTKLKVRYIIEYLVMLPWAIPASAIAINIINAFNHESIFALNTILLGTTVLLPIAYSVSLMPLMVRYTSLSLGHLNDAYIEASSSLGANMIQSFVHIMLPITAPGIFAGMLLVFIRSMGEYSISVFLYTASNKPISIAMVNGIFEYEIGLAMAYGALLLGLTFVCIYVIKVLTNK